MLSIKGPTPLHCPGAEHERPTGRFVERQIVGRGAGSVSVAVVEQQLIDSNRGRAEPAQSGRPGPVVQVLVPLVANGLVAQGCRLARAYGGYGGIAPEPEPR